MTSVLILGGTGWLSGRIARRWIDEGATVTCLARGNQALPPGARLVRSDRDDDDPYRGVFGDGWDEIVDVSSRPAHVRAAVEALGAAASHWSYVSSMSVYADNDAAGADESASLAPPARPGEEEDYSRAKSAAEEAVRALGSRAAITRPGLIAGPGDPSDRFGYWPSRFALAGSGPVIAPEPAGRYGQVIDVDDLADFIVSAAVRSWCGVVNAIGESRPLGDVLTMAREVAGHSGAVEFASDEWLTAHDVGYWAGPRSLPLWLPTDMPGFATRDGSAYLAAGGRTRALSETIERVLADERVRGLDRPRRAGLSRSEELDLLAQR